MVRVLCPHQGVAGSNPQSKPNSHSVHIVKLGASQFPVVIPGIGLDNKYQVDQQLTVVGFLMVRSEHSQFSEVTIKKECSAAFLASLIVLSLIFCSSVLRGLPLFLLHCHSHPHRFSYIFSSLNSSPRPLTCGCWVLVALRHGD